jgi:protein-tyrosine phosphatase
VIDLHSHILPGLDDGPDSLEGSIAMAEVAVADGVTTMVGTPHIREDYPVVPGEVPGLAREVEAALERSGVPLRVVGGGEVSFTKTPELDDATLAGLCLGDGRYLLVESPYTHATDSLEQQIFDLQSRGFRPLLAHPERSPSFMSDRDRLATLVERGVRCSITAASVTGAFGRTVQKAAIGMVRAGLVHDIASDSHDARRRPPGLSGAVAALESALPELKGRASWFAEDAPAAILAGDELPEPPQRPRRPRWRRPFAGRSSSGR